MPVPIFSVAQMRQWEEASWKAGRSQMDVIRRVGHRVAQRAHRMLKRGDSVVVLHGRGNNGQDALQASRLFVEHEVHRIEGVQPDRALELFREVLPLRPGLIIDGIFGTGLSRPLDAGFQALVEAVNASGIPVLAVDMPSGLDGDSGRPLGAAIKAQVTLTLGAPKRGLLSPGAYGHVGRLELASNIGLIEPPLTTEWGWSVPADFRGYPPVRPVDGHKGMFGHVAILAGSLGYHGAAVLAARGAQRAQPGLVTVLTQPGVYHPIASQLQSAMVLPVGPIPAIPKGCTVLLAGPGLAAADVPAGLKEWVRDQWKSSPLPMVVDASALDWLAESPPPPALRVITPHPGEAARMLGWTVDQVTERRFEAVRALSQKFGHCWVVLKGCQTLIGRFEGPGAVNPTGNPHLAQGGAGDVLAGWISGLLAQPALAANPSQVLRYATWIHGRLADDLQRNRPNWTIEDLAAWPIFPDATPADSLMLVPEE